MLLDYNEHESCDTSEDSKISQNKKSNAACFLITAMIKAMTK